MKKTQLKKRTQLKANKNPKKHKKPKTISKLEKDADEVFSKYIRLRDSDFKKSEWVGTCISCNKKGVVAYIDETGKVRFTRGWNAGHFVSRTCKVIRFDEENVNLQCANYCNKNLSGNLIKYEVALDKKYGEDTAQRLREVAKTNMNFEYNRDKLIELIEETKKTLDYMLTHY